MHTLADKCQKELISLADCDFNMRTAKYELELAKANAECAIIESHYDNNPKSIGPSDKARDRALLSLCAADYVQERETYELVRKAHAYQQARVTALKVTINFEINADADFKTDAATLLPVTHS